MKKSAILSVKEPSITTQKEIMQQRVVSMNVHLEKLENGDWLTKPQY